MKALSSKRPKQVWKTIHRILHPSRVNPDDINRHFGSTAERVTASSPVVKEELYRMIDEMDQDSDTSFRFRYVTYNKVLREIKGLRADCSTGHDNIPTKFIKLVAEHVASPLTHILNTCIMEQEFPLLWKVARISPIPKIDEPQVNDDYRPVSILPALSKIYEKLALRQMVDFLTDNAVMRSNISAYRKGHSTTTTLAIRDDILKAMKRGEVTLAVMADFSKAFDTVAYETILSKLHQVGFSKSSLRWVTSYLTDRSQYVQVDDRLSNSIDVNFGVPQGSILGPVLFNLYVNNLSEVLPTKVKCHQNADDTTLYTHCKPSELQDCQQEVQDTLNRLSTWSSQCNLALNPKKTKVMLFSTAQLSRVNELDSRSFSFHVDGKKLERVSTFRLLGTQIHKNLNWTDEINIKISNCYGTLSVIRKLKFLAPFDVRKQLAECLIMSKIDYNDIVSHPIPEYLLKRLQRVQLAAAGFVLGRYAEKNDLLKLGWLPINERRESHLLHAVFKAMHSTYWPSYLKLDIHNPGRTLRSSSEITLKVPIESGTFQDCAAKAFNALPSTARNSVVFNDFKSQVKKYLINKATARFN